MKVIPKGKDVELKWIFYDVETGMPFDFSRALVSVCIYSCNYKEELDCSIDGNTITANIHACRMPMDVYSMVCTYRSRNSVKQSTVRIHNAFQISRHAFGATNELVFTSQAVPLFESKIATIEYVTEEIYNKLYTNDELDKRGVYVVDKGEGVVGIYLYKYPMSSGADIDLSGITRRIDELEQNIEEKQDKLVSGRNIKTINGQSILGEGNIVIEGGGGNTDDSVTGVKGNAETEYRKGNVNITPENIGLGNVDNTKDADKTVKHAVSADRAGLAGADAAGNIITATYATKEELSQTNSELSQARTDASTANTTSSEAKDIAEQAARDAEIAKNAVATLEGLANTTTAQETLAAQVVQIEQNRSDILTNKQDADEKLSELGQEDRTLCPISLLSDELIKNEILLYDTISGVYVRHDTQSLYEQASTSVEVYDLSGVDCINIQGKLPDPAIYYGIVGFSSDLERTKFMVVGSDGINAVDKNLSVPTWAKYAYVTKGATAIKKLSIKHILSEDEIGTINNNIDILTDVVLSQSDVKSLTFVENIPNAYIRHDTQSIQAPYSQDSVDVYSLEGVNIIKVTGSVTNVDYFGVVGFSSDLERTRFVVISPNGIKDVNIKTYVPSWAKYAYVNKKDCAISSLELKDIPSEQELSQLKDDSERLLNLKLDISEKESIPITETISGVYVRHDTQSLQTAASKTVEVYSLDGIDYINLSGTLPDPAIYYGIVGFSSDLERTKFMVVGSDGINAVDKNLSVPTWAKYAYVTKGATSIKKLKTKHIFTDDEIIELDNRTFSLLDGALNTKKLDTLVDTISGVYVRHDTQSLYEQASTSVEVYDLSGVDCINIQGKLPDPAIYYGIVGFSSDLERSKFRVVGSNDVKDVNVNTFIPTWAKYAYITKGATALSTLRIKDIQDEDNTIIAVGDSITQGQDGVSDPRLTTNEISNNNSYTNELEGYLPEGYIVKNLGAGGARLSEIFSRMGWLCGILPFDFELKGDGSSVVIATAESPMVDNYMGQVISYFMQGNALSKDAIQTAYIRGIECNFTYTEDRSLSVSRKNLVDFDVTIKEGTELVFKGASIKGGIYIVFAGTNGEYSSVDELVDITLHAVRQIETEYIVIGSHTFSSDALKALRKEFGSRFINLKEYLTSLQSFRDIGYEPLTDAEITAERKSYGVISDIQAIAEGTLPPSYWRYSYTPSMLKKDFIHYSKLGYQAVAYIINRRLNELGYLT